MQNALMRNIKKFILGHREIRRVVATNKHLMNIVNTIDLFADLCRPSKIRIRQMMQVHSIEAGHALPLSDSLHADFLYVCQGKLAVVFQHTTAFETESERVQVLRHGDYVDFVWKESEFEDYVIKEVLCLPDGDAESLGGRENGMSPIKQQRELCMIKYQLAHKAARRRELLERQNEILSQMAKVQWKALKNQFTDG